MSTTPQPQTNAQTGTPDGTQSGSRSHPTDRLLIFGLLAYMVGSLAFLMYQGERGYGLYGYIADLEMRQFGHFDSETTFFLPFVVWFISVVLLLGWHQKRQQRRQALGLTPARQAASPEQTQRMLRKIGRILVTTGALLLFTAFGLYRHLTRRAVLLSHTPLTRATLAQLESTGVPTAPRSPYVQIVGAFQPADSGWSYTVTHMPSGEKELIRYVPLRRSGDGPDQPVQTFVFESMGRARADILQIPPPISRDGTFEGEFLRRDLPIFVRGTLTRQGIPVAAHTYILESQFLGGQPPASYSSYIPSSALVTGVVGVIILATGLLERLSPSRRLGS